jgi:hypothetical protein
MTRTVLDQLAAFRRGDWAAAYAFASSAIQAQFGPEAFRAMVTRGYAPIARSATARVGRVEALDGHRGLVEVRVEGENGETIDALYELLEEQGVWRVNGVLTRPVERGTTASAGPAAKDGRGTDMVRAGGSKIINIASIMSIFDAVARS